MKQEKRYIDYQPLGSVPGLAFRHFSGDEDYQLKLDLWTKARDFYGYDWFLTLEDVKNHEKWCNHYDINEQLVFVELHGEPIGYLEYNWNREEMPTVRAHYIGLMLLEEYWDSPIPAIMLTYQEKKLTEMTAERSEEIENVYQIWAKLEAKTVVKFFKGKEYVPERYFFDMVRPISKPLAQHPMPEGLEIREVKAEDYRKIWNANEEAFKDHWGFSESTDEQYQAWHNDRLCQPHLWKIAWDGDEVAGQVGNMLDEKENQEFNRKRGYTEVISVGRKWRKRGLAKAMIAASIQMFREMGMEETALGVDAENPNGALKLYTGMGYEEEPEKTSMVLRKKMK